MYLLKLHHTTLFQLLLFDSHSTMYLLKRFTECRFRIDFTAFTFHHVSIKTHCICCFAHSISDSHSTMYLLKLQLVILLLISLYDSHSTMYLLKRFTECRFRIDFTAFTFHHVSIKTHCICCFAHSISDSHSTMYLLKLQLVILLLISLYDSHSTMYLLKPVASSSISYTS